jgi:membrane protease YdiL (CAAX protease family)
MDPSEVAAVPEHYPPPKTWVDRIQAFFEVLLLAGGISSLLATLPFIWRTGDQAGLLANTRVLSGFLLLEAAVTFTLLYLVMKAHGEKLRDFGLVWQRWRADVLFGLAIVPILFGVNAVVSLIFQTYFPKLLQEHNPLAELVRTPQDLALFIGTALIAGGIKEELQRAFILRRFQAFLGGANLGLIVWSVVFAIGHKVQGELGMTVAGIYGLIFGMIYLARGTLTAPIVAHGVYDAVALLGYWFTRSHS